MDSWSLTINLLEPRSTSTCNSIDYDSSNSIMTHMSIHEPTEWQVDDQVKSISRSRVSYNPNLHAHSQSIQATRTSWHILELKSTMSCKFVILGKG